MHAFLAVVALSLTEVPASEPAVVSPVSETTDAGTRESFVVVKHNEQTEEKAWYQKVDLNGFARIGVFYTFPLRDEQLVGGNGGFRIVDFRLGADFHPIKKLTLSASVELSAMAINPNDPLSGSRAVQLRDAFFQYDVCVGFSVKLGQFRPPFSAEMLTSDGQLPFISRSILSEGLTAPEGYGPRHGIVPDRQVGLQVGSQRLGNDTIGLKYMVGVFNGNGQNVLFNDNNIVAPAARVEVDLYKNITLGLNAYYNISATGVRPNRLYTSAFTWGADLKGEYKGFSGLAVLVGRNSSYNFQGLTAEMALGAVGQVRYFHEDTGLEGAVRYTYLEPSSVQQADMVQEIAAMVGWKLFKLPFRIFVQYSHREEESAVAYPNDSVDLMLHAVW